MSQTRLVMNREEKWGNQMIMDILLDTKATYLFFPNREDGDHRHLVDEASNACGKLDTCNCKNVRLRI